MIDAAPLAERMRPRRLEDVVGQEHLTAPDAPLGRMVAARRIGSLILWGPPGTGKTSIARLLAEAGGLRHVSLSAIFSGVADLKKVFADAAAARALEGPTLLFVDEIHRFNRTQQDAFLPVVEDGTIILVGATTENPSFELNGALLSRCQLLILRRLDEAALAELLTRAEMALQRSLPIDEAARDMLIALADGDGRFLLNQVERLVDLPETTRLGPEGLEALLQRRPAGYDKDREGHHGLISAMYKAMRGSDPDAALYYVARMLRGGEDPLYVARRIVRFASEDVGLADPQALVQAMAAVEAYRLLGSPEGELAIVQACIYNATAPKSNAVYKAEKAARRLAESGGSVAPPAHILNAPTKTMKAIGRGDGYRYDHDQPDAFSGQNYWPSEVGRHTLYAPSERGFEARLRERLAWWAARRAERSAS